MTPYGKSVTIKTEDFPLTKRTIHDTNLTDAQLLITRDAEGRHHIGQITYKSEEDLTQQHTCPHHHNPSSPIPKVKSVRGTGRLSSPSTYNKQSSPSTDQDYSSYTPSSSIETKSYKTEPIKKSKTDFTDGTIDNIDSYITPTYGESENDFDISDIGDILPTNHQDEDITNMDEDSLESCEAVLVTKKKPAPPPPIISDKKPIITKVKSGGVCTALYLAQKQKQASVHKNSSPTILYTRSNTLPNVIEALKKEELVNKSRRKSAINSQRSQSIELLDKSPLNDISKLDRDSGFDEQDFRCERLQSSYDDNSSVSSLKTSRSSIARSLSSDLNGQTYRENKAYELRLKALDYTRILNEQSSHDKRLNTRRNFNYTSTRTNEMITPIVHKYRKNNQQNFYLKH
jgi:hypothetical protein